MIDYLAQKIAHTILPKTSYHIGIRQQVGVKLLDEPVFTVNIHGNREEPNDICAAFAPEDGERQYGKVYFGETPKAGDTVRLWLFNPGIATGTVYGTYDMPVDFVTKNGFLDEVVVHLDDMTQDRKVVKN